MANSKEDKAVYVPKSTADLLPFVCVDKDIFYMSDKSYMDLFRIVTKDLVSASESEVPAGIARETMDSHRSRPREKAAMVTVPCGIVWV